MLAQYGIWTPRGSNKCCFSMITSRVSVCRSLSESHHPGNYWTIIHTIARVSSSSSYITITAFYQSSNTVHWFVTLFGLQVWVLAWCWCPPLCASTTMSSWHGPSITCFTPSQLKSCHGPHVVTHGIHPTVTDGPSMARPGPKTPLRMSPRCWQRWSVRQLPPPTMHLQWQRYQAT